MKNHIKVFLDQEVRIIEKEGEILFCLTDVSSVLGLTNAYRQVSGSKGVHTVHTLTTGGSQKMIYVDEPVLYRLIFKSRKESATRFQDWVFEEVLPSIRKTGKYNIPLKLRKKSAETRNHMTDTWKENGVNESWEYADLTLTEYRLMGLEKSKRKADMTKEEILLLQAIESMETLNLHYNPRKGYFECRKSLVKTGERVLKLTGENEYKEIKE